MQIQSGIRCNCAFRIEKSSRWHFNCGSEEAVRISFFLELYIYLPVDHTQRKHVLRLFPPFPARCRELSVTIG